MSQIKELQNAIDLIENLDNLVWDISFTYSHSQYGVGTQRAIRDLLNQVRYKLNYELHHQELSLLEDYQRANNPLNPTAKRAAG